MSPRRLVIEWASVVAALCVLAAAVVWSGAVNRFDATLYDVAVRFAGRAPSTDIVIVAIDERSLARLGRWPWPRHHHAQLIERLTQWGAAGVAFDILFSEPDAQDPQSDTRLAAGLRAHGTAVLPMHMDAVGGRVRAILPSPSVAEGVRVGHVNTELDRDGVARSVFLREGVGAARHPHLALALLEAVGRAPHALPGERAPRAPDPDAWARDYRYGIPFAGPPGHFRTVSYVDLLDGIAPEESIRGRLVLVGATAIGIKDALPTPFAGHSAGMAGVEIVANVLDGLIQGAQVRRAPPGAALALAIIAMLAVMFSLVRLRPRSSLWFTVAGIGLVFLLTVSAPRWLGVWVEPSAALLVLVMCYPLWSWRRLQLAYGEMRRQIDELGRESAAVAIGAAASDARRLSIDPVQRRVAALRDAGARLRRLKRFVVDALDGMSDAVLVTSPEGRVVLANARAGALFGRDAAVGLLGRQLRELFQGWKLPEGFDPARPLATKPVPVHAPDERTLLVSTATCVLDEGVGTICTFTDVTAFAVADARRREALSFLSHDLRAPLSSILAMVGLERAHCAHAMQPLALERIESATRHAIRMADDFTAIARAEQLRSDDFGIVDLRALCEESIDLVHGPATAKEVTLRFSCPYDEVLARAEPSLLRRAVVNLLQNAIQYGPASTAVEVSIASEGERWRIKVRDHGRGIPVDELEQVFSRFRRGKSAGRDNPSGVGLGLALVRVVARRHGGDALASNATDGGAEFVIEVPVASEQPAEPSGESQAPAGRAS